MPHTPERRLLLLRHGETVFNAERRMQGQLDTGLSANGAAQAERVADYLAVNEPGIGRIISSDLARARVTAETVGKRLGRPVELDERLRETHLGEWQGRTHAEIDAAHPGRRDLWRHDAEWAPAGGETRVAVAARMRTVVDDLLADDSWPGSTILLVAHGGAIAALTATLLGVPVSHYTMFNGLRNTAWVELTARTRPDGELGWYLGAFNAELLG